MKLIPHARNASHSILFLFFYDIHSFFHSINQSIIHSLKNEEEMKQSLFPKKLEFPLFFDYPTP
jgi:hypothetical protein